MVVSRATAFVILAFCSGCATAGYSSIPPPARESRAGVRSPRRVGPASVSSKSVLPKNTPAPIRLAIESASALVGKRDIVVNGVDYGDGCMALVRAAFDRAGHTLGPEIGDVASLRASAEMARALKSSLRPAPGDLVFFADQRGGAPEHVGLVERVKPDGTATVLHLMARGVMRVRVNLSYPDQTNDPSTGRRINDLVMANKNTVPAGSLVVGLADLLTKPELVASSSLKESAQAQY